MVDWRTCKSWTNKNEIQETVFFEEVCLKHQMAINGCFEIYFKVFIKVFNYYFLIYRNYNFLITLQKGLVAQRPEIRRWPVELPRLIKMWVPHFGTLSKSLNPQLLPGHSWKKKKQFLSLYTQRMVWKVSCGFSKQEVQIFSKFL